MDESESEIVIVNEISTEDSESKIVHKIINTNELKDAIYETEDEERSVKDNSVINETIYFNLFECGKIFLNNLDAKFERACMETSNDNYYM